MHNSFLIFDFGSNEEAVQQARHKLEGWKQAFRLDKKLLYKFEREEPAVDTKADGEASIEEKSAAKSAKSKAKPVKKSAKAKSSNKSAKEEGDADEAEPTGNTKLLVRLYFSGHEKLTYQRWIDRIPTEQPFNGVSSEVIHQGDAAFDEANNRFENLN
jgi:hypothetical protein